ncbi:interferon gamma receptor 1 isoform X2 [Rana temporaria]|uniref:interferon gamma receptor 1 isoform X2 n=1 Tax=Rana temporaria TaxID=8407 RepID=UPI001AAD91E5|nr:interferon gamma receptor 1 isoform X2 [Rana temporaria]
MAAVIVFLLPWVLLLLCVTNGRPSPVSEAEEVPEPFNLTVNSYNFNTTFHWDYNRMEIKPYFSVDMNWKGIETCQNISHRYCDLTHEIDSDPLNNYKVRVKALVGSKISSAAKVEFSVSNVGIIGPPELKVLKREEIVEIEITHPKVPSIHEIELYYKVYYGNESKMATDCDSLACTVTFSISDLETYCFSAEGVSDFFIGMTMERSKEMCFSDEKGISHQAKLIIIGVAVVFLVILAISCFIIARWTKARSLLPQSLDSVVRNIAAQMPTHQTPRYDNVSTSPIEPTVKEINYVKEKVKKDTDVSTDSVSKESTDPGYHSSNEIKSSERDYQSNSSSYFHTDSSASGNNSRDTSLLEKDEDISKHAPEPPKPLTNSFGYDKPHFPKELV